MRQKAKKLNSSNILDLRAIVAERKSLHKHQQLKPLRMALVVWMIFTLTVGSIGIYLLQKTPQTRAANEFSIKTGYYYGNGVNLSISGLGFTPQVVIIKSDTAAGSILWKSSVMPAAVTAYLGVATADNTETEITLDVDGFTISPALEVNTINTRYVYIAFAGSDCSSEGTMCVSSYIGNGSAIRDITTTGFQPDLVWVKRATAVVGNFRTSSMSASTTGFFSAAANDATGVYFQSFNAGGGFTVGSTNNANGSVYYYVAFKNVTNKLTVGQFTGDGADNRDITALGFEPDFVFVKQNSALAPIFNTTECWGDFSELTTATAGAVNHVQELQADGFQVGSSTNVNAAGIVSFYFAFGGAADPAPAGSFFMQRGSYTGNGTTSQSIETSFAPDLVFIKGNTTEYAVWGTSLDNNVTHYFAFSAVGFTGGITAMSTSSFTVGTSATVNSNGITYEYVAFGNASSPHTGAGASDFIIGSHTGNGSTTRAIDHLGIAPNMVVIKRPITTAALAVWKSSDMAATGTAYFSATADITNSTAICTLDSSGFTVGSGATVNTVNVTYNWFAFKEGASIFDVGSYLGTSVAQDITSVGFQPDFVWTKRSTAASAVHRSSSPTIAAGQSQHFLNLSNDVNDITGFVANGFSVGTSTETNSSGAGNTYMYAAWKSSTSSAPPSTPTNSLPANGSTTEDLNAVLTGSAYSDPDLNPQTDAQWQVDDDSNFSSSVWTRTAGSATTTTSITSGNGTFANELSGKTELDHNSTYYWRMRYSDGVWSNWSTSTNFTTNIIATPTHSSPTSGGTVTTLTPTLTASSFSDEQSGHTASSAQWQIDTSDGFSSPMYDSGTTSYSSSHIVPSATFSDRSVYNWRVRYQDSSGQWSSYSTSTKFLVSESKISVKPLFGSTVVDQGDTIKIDAQVKLTDGAVINDATTTINIYNPSGTKVVDGQTMAYITNSNGVYRFSYTVATTSGSYLYEVTAVSASSTGYGAANFEVRTIASDVSSTKSTVESEQTAQTAERTAQSAERTLQGASRTQVGEIHASTTDVQTKVTDIQTKVTNIQSNMDILIGAMIVTQSTVNDSSASTTSFITALANSTNDFYKNAVLTFTSGNLDGQSRRVSGYNGSTKTIALDPALTSSPTSGDAFTIVSQNVRVEEQVAEHETAQSAFRTNTTSRLTSIEGKIDTITANLNIVDTNLDSVLSTVNSIRSSQQKNYKAALSDVSEIQVGTTYRAKLTILDFESNPVDATSTPTILIYDATRAVAQATTTMTKLSTGVYEYTASIASSSTTGLWESIVNIDVGGTANITHNDYWQVTGAPAQVLINSLSDLTVPSIAANVTITNEGSSAFEYRYEWCVVSSQVNQCGGDDDVYYGSATKLIAAGDSFNPSLTATVSNAGDYWFKVVVYYGTEASGASRTFTATTEEGVTPPPSSGGAGGVSASLATLENIYSEIIKMRNQLGLNSQKLVRTLEILGIVSPAMQNLLSVNILNTESLTDIQNKVADLRAISSATRRIIEQGTVEPIVETYMKFNSVEIHFLISNPGTTQQTVKFKAFLPEEAKPEHILEKSGLRIDYDANAKVYYVSGDITLGPKETVTRKVEMKDIWVFSPEEMKSIKNQTNGLVATLAKTQYEAQGVILKNDIDSTLNIIQLHQEESYSSPQDHIVVYRENKERLARAENNLEKLKDLVVEAGASRGIVGQVGGIQTFATWGIILAIVFGFGLLAAVIFAMWRHQTILTIAAMGMNRKELTAPFDNNLTSGFISGPEEIASRKSLEVKTSKKWKKILLWFTVAISIVILAIFTIKFVPGLLSWREVKFENGEAPAVASILPSVLPQEKSIGSKLVQGTQKNAEVISSNSPSSAEATVDKEYEKEGSVMSQSVNTELKIADTPTGWLNVRDSASLGGKAITKVYPGEEYEYVAKQNGWYQIILNNGASGWVYGKYIQTIRD